MVQLTAQSMPASMSAAVLANLPATALELHSRPVPVPEHDDDVVLRVEACGICGTDLHILRGESYRPDLPFTLGHEPVGVVVAAGATAESWMGKRATITLFTGDGTCPVCLAGDERLCPHLQSITGVLVVDGAYAEFVRVHARQLVEVPDSLSGPEVASLVDSGATAANSIRVALEARAAQVLVVGAGPIGFLAAEMLQADAVAHQVVEPNELRRAKLAALGHTVIASFDQVAGQSDVVVDCTGVSDVMAPGVAALTPHGLYVLAGYARVPDFDFGVVSRKEATIRGVRSGRREDLERLISLVASRKVRLPEISTWPLSEVNVALEALRTGAVPGKAVIIPDPLWEA
ncbi:MAG: alcohol dehydrogenase catalytic domain-containing protein [Acidimicrobiales bacterium]